MGTHTVSRSLIMSALRRQAETNGRSFHNQEKQRSCYLPQYCHTGCVTVKILNLNVIPGKQKQMPGKMKKTPLGTLHSHEQVADSP